MIRPQGRFAFKALSMTFFLAVAYLFFKENGRKAKQKLFDLVKQPWLILFLLCLGYMFSCTIMGRYYTKPYKIVLGSFGIFNEKGTINSDLIANVIMFVPFTFLYLEAFNPANPWKKSLLISLITTLFFEVSQLIGWLGNFQIADIIHNVIGGMIGCIIWHVWEKLILRTIKRNA